ncbi:MAG: PDZ domain-containing protein, partial [Anaerolineae bacterium]
MIDYHPAAIADVARQSAAERCGLRSGDRLLALNDQPLRDVIDVQVYSAEPELQVLFERAGQPQRCEVARRYGEPLGLDFAEEIFDGEPRICRNNCDFCFVTQMPVGLRSSLYVKDDYRLSFLHGNYITLTNLGEADWHRIEEQYLTPLYISVHATEPDVRISLMHNPRAGAILEQLERLVDMGIELHTQAVLVP